MSVRPTYFSTTSVHQQMDRSANDQLPREWKLGSAALQFIGKVQADVDLLVVWNPDKGGPFESLRYQHALYPIRGYDSSVCRDIAAKKEKKNLAPQDAKLCRPSFEDLIESSENSAVKHVAALIRESQGHLSSQQIGEILYLFGSFSHFYQDLKHTEPKPITWRDHVLQPVGKEGAGGRIHLKTDAHPSPQSRASAIARTSQFSQRFWSRIKAQVGHVGYFDQAFSDIQNFKSHPRKTASSYKPAEYSKIFPAHPAKLPSRWSSPLSLYTGFSLRSKGFQLGLTVGKFWRLTGPRRFQAGLGGSANLAYEFPRMLRYTVRTELYAIPVIHLFFAAGVYGNVTQSFTQARENTLLEFGVHLRTETPLLTMWWFENQISLALEARIPLVVGGRTPMDAPKAFDHSLLIFLNYALP